MRRSHKDIDFAVADHSGNQKIFKKFDEAAGFAVSLAASDGLEHDIDVLVYSVAGARAWGGDDAVEQYREDPDASVHERISVRAEARGRIS